MAAPTPDSPSPKRSARAPRERSIRLRVSDAEYDMLQAKAKETGMSVSALLRDHFGQVRVRNRADAFKHLAALNRIGSNLNQIAKWCNTYKSAADAVQVMGYLADVRRSFEQLTEAMERR